MVQWLGLHASSAEGSGLVPGWGTKIPTCLGAPPKKKKVFLNYINVNIESRGK